MIALLCLLTIGLLFFAQGWNDAPLEPWHTEKLTEEFTVAKANEVRTFEDYMRLEARLFSQLEEKVYARIAARVRSGPDEVLPPILVFKSTVDSTVTTEAVVDRLLALLPPRRHELVLFDINRSAAKSTLLYSDPGPLTNGSAAEPPP